MLFGFQNKIYVGGGLASKSSQDIVFFLRFTSSTGQFISRPIPALGLGWYVVREFVRKNAQRIELFSGFAEAILGDMIPFHALERKNQPRYPRSTRWAPSRSLYMEGHGAPINGLINRQLGL